MDPVMKLLLEKVPIEDRGYMLHVISKQLTFCPVSHICRNLLVIDVPSATQEIVVWIKEKFPLKADATALERHKWESTVALAMVKHWFGVGHYCFDCEFEDNTEQVRQELIRELG